MDKPVFLVGISKAFTRPWWLGLALLSLTACKNVLKDEFTASDAEKKPAANGSAPTISTIADVTISQDSSATVTFTINDIDSALDCQSAIYLSNSNQYLLPTTYMVKSGVAPNCSLKLTPAPGYWGSATIRVQVYDGKFSANTTFNLNVSEGPPAATAPNTSASEGSNVAFTVQLTAPSPLPKSVTYATSDGTAIAGSHYTATSGTLIFAAGETSKLLNVPTVNDGVHAPDRNFTITLTAMGVSSTATGTITNIDAPPTASAAAASANEGANLTFTVNLNRTSTLSTSVTYSTANGTALAGTNYTNTSGTLTYLPGESSKTVTVPSLNDGTHTGNLTFTLSMTANGTTNSAMGTVVNTDALPTASAGNISANEGSNLTFTVLLDRPASTSTTVTYATANGSALAGTNYTNTSGTLTYAAGETSKTVTVSTANDSTFTPNLTFTMGLTANSVTNNATGTVINTDAAPTASAANMSANEGSNLTFTVNLNRPSSSATSVTYATVDGTALAGTHYTNTSGTLTYAAGETSKTVVVPSANDSIYTPNLTFTLDLTANAFTNSASGTVVNVNAAPTATASAASANEGSDLTFTVNLDRASSASTTVTYTTVNGTAIAGTNYTTNSGTLTYAAGETSKTVTVSSLPDSTFTPNLTFTLSMTANAITNSATGTITNTDAAPTASAANVSANEGSTLTFTVNLNRPSSTSTAVTYATVNGTALSGTNYTSASGTLTYAAGETSKSVVITSINDNAYSANLNFTLDLTANAVTNSATGTIVNTTTVPTVSIASASSSLTEGNSAGFTISLNHASAFNVQVDYATSSGTAISGSDFTAGTSTATINAGSLSTTVNIATTDDNADEQDENFSIAISSPVNATLATTSANVTIQDTALYFDFTAGSLPSGVSFARTSTATYFDSSGVMQTATAGTPRFDHDPTACAGSCAMRGLLIEGPRTNLLLRSAAFDSTWASAGSAGVTVTANTDISPDNATTADTIASASVTTANNDRVEQTVSLLASTTYTLSFYVKSSTSMESRFDVVSPNSGSTGKETTITWTGGVPSLSSGTVEALASGWYRLQITFTTNASDAGATVVAFYPATSAADTLGEVILWGAQLEAGPSLTSYIPTTVSMVTRAADSLSVNSFATWFNATTFTAILDFVRPFYEQSSASTSPTLFSACDSTSGGTCDADRFEAIYQPSDNTFRGRSYVSSVNTATSNYTNGANLNNVTVQAAVSQSSAGEIRSSINGTNATLSGAGMKPILNTFILGSSGRAGAYTNQLQGHLKKFTYRARALTAGQMQALTSD